MELARLLFLPLLGALVCPFLKRGNTARIGALALSLVSFLFTVVMVFQFVPDASMQFLIDYT